MNGVAALLGAVGMRRKILICRPSLVTVSENASIYLQNYSPSGWGQGGIGREEGGQRGQRAERESAEERRERDEYLDISHARNELHIQCSSMVDDEPRSLTMKLIEECTAGISNEVAGSPEERYSSSVHAEQCYCHAGHVQQYSCLIPTTISPKLERRCGSALFDRAADLLKVEVLRLDWQRIASIQNLDIFTHLRELYLQHNRIHVIEELDTLRNLEFLALGSNRIRRLENLRHLRKVRVWVPLVCAYCPPHNTQHHSRKPPLAIARSRHNVSNSLV